MKRTRLVDKHFIRPETVRIVCRADSSTCLLAPHSNSPDDAPAPQDDWVARVSALEKLEQEMKSCPEEDLGAQWASAVVVLDEMVRDKLTPVFLASLSALQTAVGRCCRIVGEDTARDDLRRITPALVARAGNISARVRGDTIAALCALGRGLGCDYVLQQLLDHKGKGKLSAAQLVRAPAECHACHCDFRAAVYLS